MRTELKRLQPEAQTLLEFELSGDGIVEFVIEGRDTTGRAIRNAVGLVTGEPPTTGVRRLGAIEFPAAVLPRPESR